MSQARFSNALRILQSIDRDELVDAGIDLPDTVAWLKFRDDPFRWFIRACDADADKVWAIIEGRQR